MSRLVRNLFTLCAAASLLVCVTSLVLWMRGYTATDVFGMAMGRRYAIGVASERGSLVLLWADETPDRLLVWKTRPAGFLQDLSGATTFVGFGWQQSRGSLLVFVPCWLIAPSSLAVAMLLIRQARKMRFAPGLCPICGYDLRASPHRCPECGASHPSQVTA